MSDTADVVPLLGEQRVIDAEIAIHHLLVRLFHSLDRHRFEALPLLFAESGEWRRPDGILTGRASIARFLRDRDNSHTMRHVLSNVWVSALEVSSATFAASVTVFADAGAPAPALAPPLYRLGRIRDVSGVALRSGSGWLLSQLAIDRVFKD